MIAPSEWDIRKANREIHDRERQILFGNEAFALGALQTVSAATAFGILSQFPTLKNSAGELPIYVAFSCVILALACSILGSYCRHQYKMWDVKGGACVASDPGEASRRYTKAGRYLTSMRRLMACSAVLVVGSLLIVLGGMWFRYFAR